MATRSTSSWTAAAERLDRRAPKGLPVRRAPLGLKGLQDLKGPQELVVRPEPPVPLARRGPLVLQVRSARRGPLVLQVRSAPKAQLDRQVLKVRQVLRERTDSASA